MRQQFSVFVQHKPKVDIISDDIREWLEVLLEGKVSRYVGYTDETYGSYSYGEVITGCLIIEDQKQFDEEEIESLIKIPHDKWEITKVAKRS